MQFMAGYSFTACIFIVVAVAIIRLVVKQVNRLRRLHRLKQATKISL